MMTHNEHIDENNRQIAELEKIIESAPGTPKARRAKAMIVELREDTQWRRDQMVVRSGS